jgi:cysteine desulfurase/selenocysteine lyase
MSSLAHLIDDFPILGREINGHRLAYLDSAATTQKPASVIKAISDYYENTNANVHRGAHTLAHEATVAYEGGRAKVAQFIGAASPNEIVFTRGTSAAINLVAYGWGLRRLTPGDRIVITLQEHHSNIVPWQLIAELTGAELAYLELNDDYTVDTSMLEKVIDERTKIVGISGMSNVTGAIGPVADATAAARAVGAIVVMDGAQSVPHTSTAISELDVDFLAFSAHKMLGPTGIGALWGKPELLEEMNPVEGGGEMITDVGLYESRWAPVPHKFEAGTPAIAQAVGWGAAVDYLSKIGMDEVRRHEVEITKYALERMAEIPDLTVYGPTDLDKRGGAVSFELGDIHAHDLATILDEEGVAVRAGHHCAKPLMRYLEVPATARASFYVYTIKEDIDQMVKALWNARKLFGLD